VETTVLRTYKGERAPEQPAMPRRPKLYRPSDLAMNDPKRLSRILL
jgi:hypothetical protein